MKVAEQLEAIARLANGRFHKAQPSRETYPIDVVDLIVFHKLHFHMDMQHAWRSYRQLKTHFVDWNEVRISSIREIQEKLVGAQHSLELAVFIKDFLEHLHGNRQRLCLEGLGEENLTEIRRSLAEVKGMEPATVDLVLLLRKEHPIVPLSSDIERSLARIGVVRRNDTRNRKGKRLFELLGSDSVLAFHHFLLQHTRQTCPAEEESLRCSDCQIRTSCNYFTGRARKARNGAAATNGRRHGSLRTSASAAGRSKRTSSSRPRSGRVEDASPGGTRASQKRRASAAEPGGGRSPQKALAGSSGASQRKRAPKGSRKD